MNKTFKTFCILAFILCLAVPCFSSMQCTVNASCGGVSSCTTAAFGTALTNPSLLLAGGATDSQAVTLSSSGFIDSGAGYVIFANGGGQVLVEQNTSTATTGITVAATGPDLFSVWACEETGASTAAGTGAIDATCSRASGTSSAGGQNTSCSSAMTLTGTDVVFAFVFPTSGPMTAGTSFTLITTAGGLQERASGITTPFTPTAVDNGGAAGDTYGFIGVAIKPAAAAGPGGLTVLGSTTIKGATVLK